MKKIKCITLITVSILILSPIPVLSTENTFELKLDAGKLSTTVGNAVIRGDMDSYHFNAKPGQRIATAITSFEDNAVFEVFYRKNSKWSAIKGTQEGRVWYGTLPQSESNRYKIEVGGTRGNASYELFVGFSVIDN